MACNKKYLKFSSACLVLITALLIVGSCRNTTEKKEKLTLDVKRIEQSAARKQLFAQFIRIYANRSRAAGRLRDDLVGVHVPGNSRGIYYYGGRKKKTRAAGSDYAIIAFSFQNNAAVMPAVRRITRRNSGSTSYWLGFANMTLCFGELSEAPVFNNNRVETKYLKKRKGANPQCIKDRRQAKRLDGTGYTFDSKTELQKFVTILTSAFPQIQVR